MRIHQMLLKKGIWVRKDDQWAEVEDWEEDKWSDLILWVMDEDGCEYEWGVGEIDDAWSGPR